MDYREIVLRVPDYRPGLGYTIYIKINSEELFNKVAAIPGQEVAKFCEKFRANEDLIRADLFHRDLDLFAILPGGKVKSLLMTNTLAHEDHIKLFLANIDQYPWPPKNREFTVYIALALDTHEKLNGLLEQIARLELAYNICVGDLSQHLQLNIIPSGKLEAKYWLVQKIFRIPNELDLVQRHLDNCKFLFKKLTDESKDKSKPKPKK